MFKVFPKPEHIKQDTDYVQCTKLREFYGDAAIYDKIVKDEILLTANEADFKSSHEIWKHFQKKFSKVGELGKFIPFFQEITKKALQAHVDQNVFVVEYRHISGSMFDEDKQKVPFLKELQYFRDIVDDI